MSNEVVDQAKTVAEGLAVSWVSMTVAQKKDELTEKLNVEISNTKSTWVKYRDKGYIVLLGFANDALLNKINSWIS